MNLDDTQKKLLEMEKQIKFYESGKEVYQLNQLGNNIEETYFNSFLPYMGFNFATISLVYSGTMANIANTIPPEIFPVITIGGSLTLGYMFKKLLDKKSGFTEATHALPKADTEIQKIEAGITYEIEQKKLELRSRIIKYSEIEIINKKIEFNYLLEDNNMIDKNLGSSKDEVQNKIYIINQTLNKKYEELDLITTKLVLANKYNDIKSQKNYNKIMIYSLSTFMYIELPLILMKDILNIPDIKAAAAAVIGPFVSSLVASTIYLMKSKIDKKQAIYNLNNSLEYNKIPGNINFENVFSLARKIDKKVEEITNLTVELYKQKRLIEKLDDVLLLEENNKEASNHASSLT